MTMLKQRSAVCSAVTLYARGISLWLCLAIASWPLRGSAQTMAVSIKQIPAIVQANLPKLRSLKEQANAVAQNISLSKNTLVPQLTAAYQADYASFNNITGMSFPGYLMPLTGPPSQTNNINMVPGSALAALIKWNPITFGQRSAAIDKANAQFQLASDQFSQELFKQQCLALYTYLDALYSLELLKSLGANITRIDWALQQSLELAKQGLKPGLDTIQFQSDLGQARINFLYAQKIYLSQLIELTRLTGLTITPDSIQLTDSLLASEYPVFPDTVNFWSNNPVLKYYQSGARLAKSSLQEINTAWRPTLDIWGNGYARGSGVAADGSIDKSQGLLLSRTNYGVGFQLSFQVFQFTQINIRKKQFQALLKSDEALVDQASLDLQKQLQTAVVGYRQNWQIAEQSRQQEQAATFAYQGLALSYQSGLIDYSRLTQGQYALLNAEIGQAGACLQVWRSLLDLAVVKGDLNLVLAQMH
jgi:outer membrane protein